MKKKFKDFIERKVNEYKNSNFDYDKKDVPNNLGDPRSKKILQSLLEIEENNIDNILLSCRDLNLNHILDNLQIMVEDINIEMKKDCSDKKSLMSLFESIKKKTNIFPYDFRIEHGLEMLNDHQLKTLKSSVDTYTTDYMALEDAEDFRHKSSNRNQSP